MPSYKLHNYIRSHRKCSGLTQHEVAFLISSGDGARISRYEHFRQQPTLETAVALEILFRTPVRNLFSGVSQKVERRIIRRAETLTRKLKRESPDVATVGKMELLEAICCELRLTQNP